jgi:hypothetical protein
MASFPEKKLKIKNLKKKKQYFCRDVFAARITDVFDEKQKIICF